MTASLPAATCRAEARRTSEWYADSADRRRRRIGALGHSRLSVRRTLVRLAALIQNRERWARRSSG